jgi:hypothetical protein
MAFDTSPYMQQYLDKAFNVANTGYTPYTGSTVAQFDPAQQQAVNMQIQRAQNGSPLVDQAQGYMQNAMGGQYNVNGGTSTVAKNPYFGSNPYIDQAIQSAQQDTVNSYNMTQAPADVASARRSGSFGNSGLAEYNAYNQGNLQKNLGNIANQMRMQDYTQQQQLGEADVGRQFAANQSDLSRGLDAQRFNSTYGMTAAGQAPGLANQDYQDISQLYNAGAQNQSMSQSNLTDAYTRWQEQQNYPLSQANIMGSALGNGALGMADLYQKQQANQPNANAARIGYGLLGSQVGSQLGQSYGGSDGSTWGGLAGGLLGYLAGG